MQISTMPAAKAKGWHRHAATRGAVAFPAVHIETHFALDFLRHNTFEFGGFRLSFGDDVLGLAFGLAAHLVCLRLRVRAHIVCLRLECLLPGGHDRRPFLLDVLPVLSGHVISYH